MWEGKLFSYILSSPSRAEKRGDDGARPPPQGIRGCPPGVLVRGCPLGAARWEHPPRPAPRTLILPGGRRRPGGGRGQPCALPHSRLLAGGHADHRPRGRWGPEPCPRVLFPCPSVGGVRVFVGAIGVERSLHRGGGGEPRHPAPSRAQEGGREHPRRGRPPGPLRRPAVERARKLLSAARWTNFSRVLGLPFLLPSRPAAPSRGGGGEGAGVDGQGTQCGGPPHPASGPAPRAPSPLAVS